MAFETNLIALSWRDGRYAVISHLIAHINTELLRNEGRLHNVSGGTGYVDEATILSRAQFERYLLPESLPWSRSVQEWYSTLPNEVAFIIVHRAEWESGMGD